MPDFTTAYVLFAMMMSLGESRNTWAPFHFISNNSSSVCNLTIDAGPDMTLCLPGNVELQGNAEGDVLFTLWSPATGLNNPNILNPTASISNTITYTLTGWGIDPANPNVIENGDFEQGNVGFSSDYVYVQDMPGTQEEMVPAGTYTVINNPFLVHEAWSPCMDHTPGTADQMMLINGELALQNFWCQTVNVLPGTYYNVEAWVSSVHPSSPAVLQFSINGTPIGPIINAPSTTCEWIPFNALWNAGGNTTAEICIINLNTTAFGNDFALDDITMVALCEVSDEVTIYLEEEPAPEPQITGTEILCAEDIATYTATIPTAPTITNYVWTVSGGSILSGQGTDEITIQWESATTGIVCLMIETECDENESCFEVAISELPEVPAITGPVSLCIGEQTNFATSFEQDVEYNWILPPGINILLGEGTNEIIVEAVAEGEFDVCVEVINDCGTTDDCTTLIIHPVYQTSFDTVLCSGTTIVINGTVYGNGNLNGIEDFFTVNGCDSLVEITITEAASLEFMQDISLCPGDSVFLGGAFQMLEGIYVDTFMAASGCDSIIISQVTISSSDTTYVAHITCDPDQAGTITETFITGNCDSTVITQTILVPSDSVMITLTSCNAADTGQVVSIFTNQFGCDSIVTIHTQFQLSDTTRLFDTSCDITDVGVFVEELTNVSGCDSLIITTVSFSLSDTTMVTMLTCSINDTSTSSSLLTNVNGCDSLVIQQTIYAGTDTTYLFSDSCFPSDTGWHYLSLLNQYGCDSIISTFIDHILSDTTLVFETSCSAGDTGTVIKHHPDLQGCDSVVITFTTLSPALQIEARVDSVHNGFGVPCNGGKAGRASVEIVSGGTAPFLVEWSTGDTTFQVSDLSGGEYVVQITDIKGCIGIDSIEVTEPDPLDLDVDTTAISCFNAQNGSVNITHIEGGVQPWTSSLNGSPFQNTFTYENLAPGNYLLEVKDANGCRISETFTLIEPEEWSVMLNPDTIVDFGTDVLVLPQILGVPKGDLQFIWSDTSCISCESRLIEISNDINLQLMVVDEAGCTAQDFVTIRAVIPERIYIPNVFTPNGDQINDYFFISTNPFIENIEELSIFDRWGNMVFQRFHFEPNIPSLGWDGRMKGDLFNPGVFAFKVVVEFRDGSTKIYHGDVTLIR